MWSELECGGGAVLGPHQDDQPAVPSPLRMEFALVSPEPLTQLAGRLAEAGVPLAEAIVDEAFGHSREGARSDGLVIQINRHEESSTPALRRMSAAVPGGRHPASAG
jgi:hypothetical protein